jgi:hypothetical protein
MRSSAKTPESQGTPAEASAGVPWLPGALAVILLFLLASCIVKRLTGPRLTGTCPGACDHYAECKPGQVDRERARCNSECPEVFSDRDSLMAYESLSCKDAVEYIDGTSPQAATSSL